MDARQHYPNGLIKTRQDFDNSVDAALGNNDKAHVDERSTQEIEDRSDNKILNHNGVCLRARI